MRRELLAEGMRLLAASYGRKITSDTLEAYFQLCGHIEDEAWTEAVKDVCRTEERWPSAATIIRYHRQRQMRIGSRRPYADRALKQLGGTARFGEILEEYLGERPRLPAPPTTGQETDDGS